ncbi:MAG TPA: hypothetical protein VM925_22000 [Labilithrix sp.]|nr:hypothetical protein [Labilithrix sp.]
MLETYIKTLFRGGGTCLAFNVPIPALPRPRDMAFTHDGRALVIAVDELVVFVRVDSPEEKGRGGFVADNAAGVLTFASPAGPLVITRSKRPSAITSLAVDARNNVVSGARDGTVRRGSVRRRLEEHATLAKLDDEVLRVSCEARGERVVAATAKAIFEIGDGAVRQLAAAESEHGNSSFAFAGETIAIRRFASVDIYDASGALVEKIPLGTSCFADVIATPHGIVTTSEDHLIIIAGDRSVTRVARPAHPDGARGCGRIAASGDGRYVLASFVGLSDGSLELFDLAAGEAACIPSSRDVFPDTPVAFAHDGRALSFINAFCDLTVVPFDPTVTVDADEEFFASVGALLDEGKLEAALARLRERTVRPSLRGMAASIRHQAEEMIAARQHERPRPLAPPARVTTSSLEEDDRVVHPQLGEGTVLDVNGARVTVAFAGGQRTVPAGLLRKLS